MVKTKRMANTPALWIDVQPDYVLRTATVNQRAQIDQLLQENERLAWKLLSTTCLAFCAGVLIGCFLRYAL